MQPLKTIKIFIGSSIDEFRVERVILGDYIRNINPIFKFDNVELEILKCEDIHRGNSGQPPQEEIDELLRNSDVSIFLFNELAGEGTIHEFDVARELQQTKYHEIIVFCNDIHEKSRSKELNRFLKRLKKEKFYWKTFVNIEYIEKELILCLLDYERRLLGKPINMVTSQKPDTDESADVRFATYQENENKQAQLREQIHHDIENLLKEIKGVKKNQDFTIAEKIIKVIELFKKADYRSVTTNYDKEKYSHLLFEYAQFLYKYGFYKDSEEVFLRQISLVEKLYGTESENTAASYNEIGLVYIWKDDYYKAWEYCDKALSIREKVFGTEHPKTAETYFNIGSVYWKRGEQSDEQSDFNKALEYYYKALEIDEKILGKDHPDMAAEYNNIGLVYQAKGNYDKALEYYFKALPIIKKNLGPEDPNVALICSNIGSRYYELGNYPDALKYLEKALKICKDKLGDDHPITKSTQKWRNATKAVLDFGDSSPNLSFVS